MLQWVILFYPHANNSEAAVLCSAHTHAGKARHGRTRHLRELGGLFKNDICSSWAAWLKAELRQACIRHPAVGTALHIYKHLIIKELYVALQNIRGLIARCSLRGWGGHLLLPFFFSFFLSASSARFLSHICCGSVITSLAFFALCVKIARFL